MQVRMGIHIELASVCNAGILKKCTQVYDEDRGGGLPGASGAPDDTA